METSNITFDEVRKKYEAIKLALGSPPYTEPKILMLWNQAEFDDPVVKQAREAVVWLAGDFVQNWIIAEDRKRAEKQG